MGEKFIKENYQLIKLAHKKILEDAMVYSDTLKIFSFLFGFDLPPFWNKLHTCKRKCTYSFTEIKVLSL